MELEDAPDEALAPAALRLTQKQMLCSSSLTVHSLLPDLPAVDAARFWRSLLQCSERLRISNARSISWGVARGTKSSRAASARRRRMPWEKVEAAGGRASVEGTAVTVCNVASRSTAKGRRARRPRRVCTILKVLQQERAFESVGVGCRREDGKASRREELICFRGAHSRCPWLQEVDSGWT